MIRHDDTAFGKIFEVQETITQDVLHAPRLKLQLAGRARSGRQPAFASEAHRLYLMGRSCFRAVHAKRYLRLARQMFRRALERASIIAPDDDDAQYSIACAYAVIGAKEKAIETLKSIMTPDIPGSRIEYMMLDSDLDSLRDHPLYKEWIGKLLA